jgi:predicted DNA-binding WGR domain protein
MIEQLADFRAFVRFASVDPATNRWRFYDLRWQPTLFGEGALVRTWGRQGQPGTRCAAFYPDRDQADAEVRQVVRRRLQHGYRVREWH